MSSTTALRNVKLNSTNNDVSCIGGSESDSSHDISDRIDQNKDDCDSDAELIIYNNKIEYMPNRNVNLPSSSQFCDSYRYQNATPAIGSDCKF